MSLDKKLQNRTKRRVARVRRRLRVGGTALRVSVFRSLKHVYAQIIDDTAGKTIASSSSLNLKDTSGDKKNVARLVGLDLAKSAKEKGVDKALVDRGAYRYHGRVKALVEGLREGGITV